MIVISDSNIIISAIYSPNGSIAAILKKEKNFQFIAPSFIFDEIDNHFDEIVEKSNKKKSLLLSELKEIISRVDCISVEDIPMIHIMKSIELVSDIDIDDTFFVALHLYKKHKIWTGDKVLINGLKSKGYDICITTAELKTRVYKK